jgi:glycosyltransferase involved in cell wall biosynthesis
MTKGSTLPRLLYAGDVPVEASYHGSALLYRLLQDYPPEKLRIIESSLIRSFPERRLSHVPYTSVGVGYRRLLRTRFARSYSSWLTLASRRHRRRVEAALDDFHPDVVLTVTHGYLWDCAAQFAEDQHLPLHLICHDDWPRLTNIFAFLKPHVDRRLGEVYRQAVSRLCVSPFMCDAYRERYGAPGEVLYPTRAADAPVCSSPPERLRQPSRGLTVAFAGTVNTHGHLIGLRLLAETLATLGGRLLIFGPFTPTDSNCESLNLPNVVCRGFLPSATLMERLREEVDVLFVPMSFAPEDRPNTEICFPSKLTDYTSVGLPLLIYGPDYCSAVRWARQNPCVAELVTQPEFEPLFGAVQRLSRSAETRWQLAQSALTAGEKFFSHHSAMMLFQSALRRK